MKDLEEYLVLYDCKIWSDRFNTEQDCQEHINKCVKENNMKKELFEYRRMTKEEIGQYYEVCNRI